MFNIPILFSKLLIIIPVYNEEYNIKSVIADINIHLENEADILVIDDGSYDRTKDVARQSGVKVLSLPFNLGVGSAVQTGFKYASENNYKLLVRMDADGQHRADQINKLIEPIINNEADVVIGSRFLERTGYKSSFLRSSGTRCFDFIVYLLTGQKMKDVTSGFKAYNRKTIEFFSEFYYSGYPEPEDIIHLKKNGFTIKEVPCLMSPRKKGKSSIGFIKAVFYVIKVVLTLFINKWHVPIRGGR